MQMHNLLIVIQSIIFSRLVRNFDIQWHQPDLKYESTFINTPVGDMKFRMIDLDD